MKTVLVLKGDSWGAVKEMFAARGWNAIGWPPSDDVKPDLICFTGGADVSPYLYGEENISSSCDPIRDAFERDVYDAYEDIPKVGICRGGQFLNVMNGGKMIQHIDGHHGDYEIGIEVAYDNGYNVVTREDHHQGIVPLYESAEVIGIDPRDDNVEIVWYEDTKSLCFQAHPEWDHEGTEELFFDLIGEYLEFKNG